MNVVDVGPTPPLSWRWRFGDGQSAYGPAAAHRYAAPGDYFAALRVRDAAGRENVYVREVRIPH